MTEPGRKPHNHFFLKVFSDPEHAGGELRAMLPPTLVARIDWSTLRIEPTTFVDAELRDLEADLVCSCAIDGEEAFLYVLLEHQSTVDAFMALRVLRYLVRQWDAWRDSHPEADRLPAIVPVVLHHGSRPWNAATSFHELLALSPDALASVAPLIPDFRFVLDDLAAQPVEALAGRAMSALGRVALICLARARHSPDMLAELRRFATLLEQLAGVPNGSAAFAAVMSYVLEVSDTSPDALEHFAHQLGPAAVEGYMTGLQQLTEQVREKALAEGRAEGRAELLIAQLDEKFGALSPERLAQIRGADVASLDNWGRRLVRAASLDQIFED